MRTLLPTSVVFLAPDRPERPRRPRRRIWALLRKFLAGPAW
jgi:hypothetical protein